MTRHLVKIVLCSSEYQDLLEQRVANLQVEFLAEGDVKPHVVLRLTFENRVQFGHKTATSCIMEVTNETFEHPEGEIVLRTYDTAPNEKPLHRYGVVGFRYPTRKTGKLRDYLEVLCGTAQGLERGRQSDLCLFNFVILNCDTDQESVDGCRDIVTQWFIRLHQEGYISWAAADIVSAGDIRSDIESYEFHRFIAKGYNEIRSQEAKKGGGPRSIVITDDIPMHEGTFLDERVQRIKNYMGITLPYA